MGKGPRPNDPCPCGSGFKYKKCCRASGKADTKPRGQYTAADRTSALEKLDFFIDELWQIEEEKAFDQFWGYFLDREDELPPGLLSMSRHFYDTWFAFDARFEDGERVIDHFLEQAPLSRGERTYLDAMRKSTVRLYEVTETVPGKSVTLHDVFSGSTVTVNERSASQSLSRSDWLATRVLPHGSSGGPEIDGGTLTIARFSREPLLEATEEYRERFRRKDPTAPDDRFFELLPPLVHEEWLASIFEPNIPSLANTDGESMVWTRILFRVEDAAWSLRRAIATSGGRSFSSGLDGSRVDRTRASARGERAPRRSNAARVRASISSTGM